MTQNSWSTWRVWTAPVVGALWVIACTGSVAPADGDASAPFIIGQSGDVGQPTPTPEPRPEPPTTPTCQPSCEEGACGEDGCGGSCGPCSVLTPFCFAGWCQLSPPPKEATLELAPDLIDFGLVALGEEAERTVTLTNISKATVEITHFGIAGDGAFVVVQGEYLWRSPSGTEITVELITPWTLLPGESREVSVRYSPIAEAPSAGTLRLLSNDLSAPQGHLIALRGGPPVGCVAWTPEEIAFGATVFGTASTRAASLTNCGTLPMTTGEVDISGDNAGAFSIDDAPPEVLEPGASWETIVRYEPTPGSVGASGALNLPVSWEGGQTVASLDLTGFLVLKDCPVAEITISETQPVAPGTILHLSGVNSYAPSGAVASWLWAVEQPLGGVGTFFPGSNVQSPTFTAAVAGLYRFDLSVTDNQGVESCTFGSSFFKVQPEHSIYVELTWQTPGDPDPTDQGAAVGADLDLHLAHPLAAGSDLDGDGEPEPWFDPLWDCYWFNSDPDWGPFTPPTDDDPHLLVEDIDGAGPETIGFDLPEIDTTYRVAVHGWNDHGFGPSAATVRIFLMGQLIFEAGPVSLETGDLWEVADITWLGWPDAQVTALSAGGGAPIIYTDASP